MKTPTIVNGAHLVADCSQVTERQWDRMMSNTTKANGPSIKKIIKDHIPELFDYLALDFFNPYEHQCVKKKGLLVYVHSGVEYFIKYN